MERRLRTGNILTRENFIGPWAGLPVAWTLADEFDEEAYRGNVARCCEAGMPGVYTGGTSGEFYAQDWDEFRAIARATVEECHRHQTPAMIGCTATSTRGAVLRARYAKEIGADAIQVALPFWMVVPDEQVVPFFVEVAQAAGGLPLSIYETRRAKKVLTLEQHQQIHRAVPQYLMVKANEETLGCSPDGCRALAKIVNVFVSEDLWGSLCPLGAAGSCSAAVYWNPRVILNMFDYVRKKDWVALEAESRRVDQFHQKLFEQFGSRHFTDTAYDRLAGVATGFLKSSLHSRGPYPQAMAEDVAAMRRLFEQYWPEMLDPS